MSTPLGDEIDRLRDKNAALRAGEPERDIVGGVEAEGSDVNQLDGLRTALIVASGAQEQDAWIVLHRDTLEVTITVLR